MSSWPSASLARAIFEQSPFSAVLYDMEGRLIALNAAFTKLWGVSIDSAPPEYSVFTDPQLLEAGAMPVIRRAWEAGEVVVTPPVRYDISRTSTTGEGRQVWTQGYFFPLRDDDGRIVNVALVHIDLTDRVEIERDLAQRTAEYQEQVEQAQQLNMELEEAREESEIERERLRELIDGLPEATVIYDSRWRYLYLNPAARTMVRASNLEPQEMIGRSVWQLFPFVVGTRFESELKRAAETRQVIDFEEHAPLVDGWLETRVVPISDGAVTMSRDVSRQRHELIARDVLARSGAVLASSLDSRAAVQGLAQLTVPDLADWCVVDLVRDDRLELVAVAHVDPNKVAQAPELRRVTNPDRLVSPQSRRIMEMGKGEFYGDITDEMLRLSAPSEEAYRILREIGFRTVVTAPLMARGRALGLFTLCTTGESPRRLTAADVPVVEELARRTAIALENAQLFESQQEAVRRVTRLQAVTAHLARATTVDEIADAVLQEGTAALEGLRGVLYVVEGSDLVLVWNAGSFEGQERYSRIPIDEAVPISDSVRENRTVYIEGPGDLTGRYAWLADASSGFTGALITAPLTLRGHVLGALAFAFPAPRGFSEGDRSFVEALALQCAQALDRVRLFERESVARRLAEGETRRVRNLQQLTAALTAAVTVADVAAVALEQAGPTFGAAAGLINLLSADGKRFVNLGVRGWGDEAMRRWRDYSVDAGTPGSQVIATGQPVFIPSSADVAARFPALAETLTHGDYEAVAALPLRIEDRTVGLVGFNFREVRSFEPGERALMMSFAGQCALALERARLFEAEREARAEAERANRAKADFLATMSHELRTPLNAIDGYAELMELGIRGPLTEVQREDLARIRRSQKHLLALIDDVLSFARIESGQMMLDLVPVPLDEALGALEELVAPQLRAKKLRYDYRRTAPDVWVRADPERLRQVMLNLLSNAVKYTDEGTITVEGAIEDGYAMVRVRDTGRGIPVEKLDAIFEPFVQVDQGLTRRSTGSGLGLAISRDLARRMGGDLTVESSAGRGSVFTLTLPRSE
ncbi:MAG TPA: GAF domain-containing protein [Gemmatimonadaceae bacterium]|nr:GAF domain-containing protein [Gemmatimonadaceae bacterium]